MARNDRTVGRIALSCFLLAGLVLIAWSVAEQTALELYLLAGSGGFLAGMWLAGRKGSA